MTKYIMHHGRMNELFRENRLCYFETPEMLKSAVDGMKWAVDMGIEKGSNLYNNLESRWFDYPEAERARKQQEFSEFALTTHPNIKQLIDNAFILDEDISLEQISALTSHEEWLKAFKEPDILTNPAIEPLTAAKGPKGIINSLTPEERVVYFQDYISKFITDDIRDEDENKSIFGIKGESPKDRAKKLAETPNKDAAVGAIEGVLGIRNLKGTGTTEERLAISALKRAYFRGGDRMPDGTLYSKPIRTSRTELLKILTDPEAFKSAAKPAPKDAGLTDMLMALEPADRKERLGLYIESFFPNKDSRKKFSDVFADPLSDTSMPIVIGALRILRGENPTPFAPSAVELAGMQPGFANDVIDAIDYTNGATDRLRVDFSNALSGNRSAGSLDALTGDLPPSILKGAFNMGILKNEDFKELNDLYEAKNHAHSIEHLETNRKTMALSDVVKIEKAREAQTISDIFHNMSGIEKIVLIVGAIVAARTDFGKKAMLGLGTVYFGQKFLFKNENPIDNTWSPILQGLAQKSKDITKPFGDLLGIKSPNEKITAQSLNTRISAVQKFLTEHAREDLDSSVAGFTLLSDMPLNQLAPYLVIGTEARSAYLDSSSRDFQRIVKDLQKKNGLSTRSVNTFFDAEDDQKIEDPAIIDKIGSDKVNKNLLESGNALKVVFYKVAARNPAYKRDVLLIEQAASRQFIGYDFPRGTTTISGEEIDLQRRFEFLVLQGMKEADGTTLGSFIEQSISAREAPSADEIEQINREKFAKKIVEVREYKFDGKPANLDAKFEGDTVQVGVRKGGIKYPITMKTGEFLNMKPEAIGTKWASEAVKLKKEEFKKNPHLKAVYGSPIVFDAEAIGEVVKYGANSIATPITPPIGKDFAETSAYTLMVTSLEQVYERYDAWLSKPGRTTADKDPFK